MPPRVGAAFFILTGPTAGGKTELALTLAERFGAEIVGADSRQIYRGMPVGTAAPSPAARSRVRHHLLDFVDPYERYSAARFVADAAAAIADITARGKPALVVGGTGFYLRSLCGDVELAPQPDPELRARLAREALVHPPAVLHAWLGARDAQRARDVSPADPYRIVRALEVALAPRGALSAAPLPTLRAARIPYRKVALRSDAAALAQRIAARTDAMLAHGLIEEAERIGPAAVAADAVGYRDALAFVRGQLTFDELRALLARGTRRYAKRQLTWLRTEPDLEWIGAGDLDAAVRIARELGW